MSDVLNVEHIFSQDEAIKEASRCLQCKIPNCQLKGCPIQNDIPSMNAAVKIGDFAKAYEIIKKKSSMPDICSVVCPHEKQCQGKCVLGIKTNPIKISKIEQFVAEWGRANETITRKSNNGIKVAAIGSGPASITFALKLAQEGYNVTIFEKEDTIGGIVDWGIPSFRLNTAILSRYISLLNDLQVSIKTKANIRFSNDFSKIFEKFDYVFLGMGSTKNTQFKIPNEDLDGVFTSEEFLREFKHTNNFRKCGKRVVVFGGGNAAMDVARSAIRLPQVEEVNIVYRRTINEMPACKEELDAAIKEGVKFNELRNPASFIGNKHLEGVEIIEMELGEPDVSGRRKPIDSGKPHCIMPCDTAICALGFSNEQYPLKELGIELDQWFCPIVDENYQTTRKNVYAGGDFQSGPQTVVKAMKAGQTAALHIINNKKGNI